MKFNTSDVKKIVKEEVMKLLREREDAEHVRSYFPEIIDGGDTQQNANKFEMLIRKLMQDPRMTNDVRNSFEYFINKSNELASSASNVDNEYDAYGDNEPMALTAGRIYEQDGDELKTKILRKPKLRASTESVLTLREVGYILIHVKKVFESANPKYAPAGWEPDLSASKTHAKNAIGYLFAVVEEYKTYLRDMNSYVKSNPDDEEARTERLSVQKSYDNLRIKWEHEVAHAPVKYRQLYKSIVVDWSV